MTLAIQSLTPVVESCNICGKEFIPSKGIGFFPLLYTPGICSVCNTSILKHILDKKHDILKECYDSHRRNTA